MEKKIIIEKCKDCCHSAFDPQEIKHQEFWGKYVCLYDEDNPSFISDEETIPDWCCLADAS